MWNLCCHWILDLLQGLCRLVSHALNDFFNSFELTYRPTRVYHSPDNFPLITTPLFQLKSRLLRHSFKFCHSLIFRIILLLQACNHDLYFELACWLCNVHGDQRERERERERESWLTVLLYSNWSVGDVHGDQKDLNCSMRKLAHKPNWWEQYSHELAL
jgi:hypothetical protein